MRTATFILLSFVAFGFAANAQRFSLLPSVGFENSKTTIRYNNLSSFSPDGVVFSPQAGLQFNYKTKSGHGVFLGASTSRLIVPFSFTDPENGMNSYKTINGPMQLRFETGYQFSSKPLFFKKTGKVADKPETKIAEKKSCSYAYKSHCMKNKPAASRPATDNPNQQLQKNKGGSWVRLQPSAGLGFIPSTKADVITKIQNGQTAYEYRAGNWNTALVTGMAFEFGKNKTRLFTVGFNYIKGIGNLNTQTVTTVIGTKTLTTQLKSEVSGWNMRIGVPFTLGAKKPLVRKQAESKTQQPKRSCGQYRIIYRCTKTN